MRNRLEEYDWWEIQRTRLKARKRNTTACDADTCPNPYGCEAEHYHLHDCWCIPCSHERRYERINMIDGIHVSYASDHYNLYERNPRLKHHGLRLEHRFMYG